MHELTELRHFTQCQTDTDSGLTARTPALYGGEWASSGVLYI
jgi:hypothetical protein